MNIDERRFVPITPLLAVDALILYDNKIVLIKRLNPPYKDQFALPGGFVEIKPASIIENPITSLHLGFSPPDTAISFRPLITKKGGLSGQVLTDS